MRVYFCYIDEAGDTSAIKNSADTSQPVLALGALFMPAASVQRCCAHFQSFLEKRGDTGVVIADSRNHHSNVPVSHSVFTRLHQQKHPGNLYPRILEAPLFGHSNNHAALQIADLVCPALLFPMAAQTYCTGHYSANPHVQAGDAHVGARYRAALKGMTYRYRSLDGRYRGGVTVADGIGMRPSSDLFRP